MFNIFQKRKPEMPKYKYDPEKEFPVIRSSICTGEQVAGFKDKTTGVFHEVVLIQGEEDIEAFKTAFGLKEIKKEY